MNRPIAGLKPCATSADEVHPTVVAQPFRAAIVVLLIAIAPVASAQTRVESLDVDATNAFAMPAGIKALVFLFTSTDCPISNRYAPEVRRLAAQFGPKGVLFRLVYPNPADHTPAILEHMTAFAYAGAIASSGALRDPTHTLVKYTGVTITPEAAVYAGGRIVYRGRIDDRFVDFGVDRPAAKVHDLADALAAVVAGQPVQHPVTQAVGCYIADFAK